MPKIYEYFGLVFLFYADDHNPIHVHARHGEYESKLELIYENGKLVGIKVKKSKGKMLPDKILKDAISFVKAKEKGITTKWFEFFGKKQKPAFEKITRKI